MQEFVHFIYTDEDAKQTKSNFVNGKIDIREKIKQRAKY